MTSSFFPCFCASFILSMNSFVSSISPMAYLFFLCPALFDWGCKSNHFFDPTKIIFTFLQSFFSASFSTPLLSNGRAKIISLLLPDQTFLKFFLTFLSPPLFQSLTYFPFRQVPPCVQSGCKSNHLFLSYKLFITFFIIIFYLN